MTVAQLTLDQMVIHDRSVHELHLWAERSFADGRHRYGNELTELADKLATLPLAERPAGRRWPPRYCPDCGLHLPPAGHSTECTRS